MADFDYNTDPMLRSFMNDKEVMKTYPGNEIADFFDNAGVFITGGTGFLGKLLIEKLLRTCPSIKMIYLLVRQKKGKDPQARLKEMMEDVIFYRLQKEQPAAPQKITCLYGDVGDFALGLRLEDQATIIENVNVIFHVAATVNFNEAMRLATAINVNGTREMLALAKRCRDIKSVLHVSTAFSNCQLSHIEEKFYDPPIDSDELTRIVQTHDDAELEKMSSKLFGVWPNSYAFTKAVAENVIKKNAGDLPISVFRPSIVMATYKDPIRSWIDNLYGPSGVVFGAGIGLMHVFLMDTTIPFDVVPADYVVNAMIVCCYANSKKSPLASPPKEIKIYNYVSTPRNPCTVEQLVGWCRKYGIAYPTIRAVWHPSLIMTKCYFFYYICAFFLHFVPGVIGDLWSRMQGNPPLLIKAYKKIHKFSMALAHFTTNSIKFEDTNTKGLIAEISAAAQLVYPFDIAKVDWYTFNKTHCLGIRAYVLKEDFSTLPLARKKRDRLYTMHKSLMFVFRMFIGACITAAIMFVYSHIF